MDMPLIEFTQKSSYPAVELTSSSTACSASFIELFHTSLPVDSVVGYNVGSGEDATTDAWGIPSRLGGVALVNGGAGVSPMDLFPAEDAVLPEQDTAAPSVFDQDLDVADNMFSMTPPYNDGSSSSGHPLSAEDWLRADNSVTEPTYDRDSPMGPGNYYEDDGLLVS